jgi:predicted cobalt transporter CbtA
MTEHNGILAQVRTKVQNFFEQPEIGYSGYPERDIEAHNKNANAMRFLGYTLAIIPLGGIAYKGDVLTTNESILFGVAGAAVIGMMNAFALNWEKQAMGWRIDLLEKRVEEPGGGVTDVRRVQYL